MMNKNTIERDKRRSPREDTGRKKRVMERQKRIAEAYKKGDRKTVEQHQIGAARSLDFRIDAVKKINGETRGVDGEKWKNDKDRIGAVEWRIWRRKEKKERGKRKARKRKRRKERKNSSGAT